MNSAAITAKQIPIYCKASISHSPLKMIPFTLPNLRIFYKYLL